MIPRGGLSSCGWFSLSGFQGGSGHPSCVFAVTASSWPPGIGPCSLPVCAQHQPRRRVAQLCLQASGGFSFPSEQKARALHGRPSTLCPAAPALAALVLLPLLERARQAPLEGFALPCFLPSSLNCPLLSSSSLLMGHLSVRPTPTTLFKRQPTPTPTLSAWLTLT